MPDPTGKGGPGKAPSSANEGSDLLRDLESTLGEVALPSLFLGLFPEKQVRRALARTGAEKKFRKLGLFPYRMDFELADPFTHRLRLSVERGGERLVFVDTTMRTRVRLALDAAPDLGPIDAVEIVWLELVNPLAAFEPSKPKLPGQRFPGLGMAREAFAMQTAAGRLLGAEALVTTPRWYHNATLYLRGGYRWSHAEDATRFNTLRAQYADVPLAQASHAIDDANSAPFGPLILPLSARLKALDPGDPSLPLAARRG